MSILFINGSSDLYGSSRILLQVIDAISHKRIVLIVPSRGPLTDILESQFKYSNVIIEVMPGLPLVSRNMGSLSGMIKTILKLYAAKKRFRAIIRVHQVKWAYVNTLASFITLKILRSLGIKTILHIHEMLEHDRFLTRTINRFAVSWANRVFIVSDAAKENLLLSCHSNLSHKVITVLNGIPDEFGIPLERSIDRTKVVVTYFGRIIPLKGVWFFLDTIAKMPDDIIDRCEFRIYGGPAPGGEALIDKLKQDIASHTAKSYIKLSSFINNINIALDESDIIVVPSLLKDSFPTTILEALSAGKPVVATNTGGARQSVVDGETGFLINPNDTEMFLLRLQLLITNAAFRAKLGKNARMLFLARFTSEIFATNIRSEIAKFEESIDHTESC